MSFQKIDKENNERKTGRNSILVYGYNESDLEGIDACRKAAGIDEMILISEAEIKWSLERILKKEAYSTSGTAANFIQPSLANTIIFSGTSHLELDRFIEASKTITITRPIFAGITPNNLSWSFEELVDELIKEREEIKKMRAQKN